MGWLEDCHYKLMDKLVEFDLKGCNWLTYIINSFTDHLHCLSCFNLFKHANILVPIKQFKIEVMLIKLTNCWHIYVSYTVLNFMEEKTTLYKIICVIDLHLHWAMIFFCGGGGCLYKTCCSQIMHLFLS